MYIYPTLLSAGAVFSPPDTRGLTCKTPGDWRARKIYTEIPTLRRLCPTQRGTQDSLTRFLMGSYHHHTRKGRYARRGQLTSSPHILLAFRLRSRGRISLGMLVHPIGCGASHQELSWTTSILPREVWYGLEFEPVQYVNPYHDPPLYKPTKPPSPR